MARSSLHMASSARRPSPSDRKSALDAFISCGWITAKDEAVLVEIVNHCHGHHISYSWTFQTEGNVTIRRIRNL